MVANARKHSYSIDCGRRTENSRPVSSRSYVGGDSSHGFDQSKEKVASWSLCITVLFRELGNLVTEQDF
jgi:hypothetical protein